MVSVEHIENTSQTLKNNRIVTCCSTTNFQTFGLCVRALVPGVNFLRDILLVANCCKVFAKKNV